MPPLMEHFAEQRTRHAMDDVHTIKDESLAIKALPDPIQGRRAATAAKMYAPLAASAVSELQNWVQEMEDILHEGINGLDFTIFANAGVSFLQACKILFDTATQICQQAEAFGVSPKTKAAREILTEALAQLQIPQSKVLRWKKMADQRPPEMDPALIERGAEQIRQGQFKTPEQALEVIRSTSK